MEPPINLVEYELRYLPANHGIDLDALCAYLDEVWQTRREYSEEQWEDQSKGQPFLQIGYDAQKTPFLKAGKYVGFIQFEGKTIQIIPKIFKGQKPDKAFKHLLWWLSYCRKVEFPFTDLLSDLDAIEDFPEAIIRYFAQFTYQLVSDIPYHQYEEVTETTSFVRGRLNTQQYINTSLVRGNWHQMVCDYEPFVFNNRLNQIIKYVARSLSNVCRFSETHHLLEKLIFVLDEVDDLPATAQDCDTLHFNRYFEQYATCVAMCRFFLSDSYISHPDTHQNHFCFLLPMDYVFEDFIFGVTETCLPKSVTVSSQKTEWLAQKQNAETGEWENVFQIRNDMLLTPTDKSNGKRLIVDTKYKVRQESIEEKKAGIAQSDMYQMVSYALRQNTTEVALIYPLCYGQAPTEQQTFRVSSPMLNDQPIRIHAVDVCVTGESKQEMITLLTEQLKEIFKLTTHE